MTAANVAYLMRYLFTIGVVLTAFLLLRKAASDFGGGMRKNLTPVFGYFLMVPPRPGEPDGRVRSLALFHTTVLGRHRNCDIRLNSSKVARRHANIYLYDGDWYVQPMRPGNLVTIGDIPITQPTVLRNGDRLRFGNVELIFVDEREETEREGYEYQVRIDAYELELRRRPVSSPMAFLLINLFALFSSGILLWRLGGELAPMRKPMLIVLAAFYLIFNLYYLILPRALRYCDKIVLLAVTQLCYLGIMIQLRLTLLRPPIVEKALERADGDAVKAMFSLISSQMGSLAFGLLLLPIVIVIVARTRFLEFIYPACLVLTPLLLVVTLIFGGGDETHGATLWISLGGTSIQLTEFTKITYLIVLATFFKTRPQLKTQLLFAGWAGAVMFLIMLLPDLGSIMILLPVTLLVYVVMTSEYLTTLAILGGGSVMGILAYTLFPHVRRRLAGWTTLWEQVNDSNRQIVYGLQAVARGGLFGRGLGNGSPEGIPVVASDMVYTILCEEFGLLIGLAVVAFFIVIWLRAAKNMVLLKDGFSSSLTLGVGSLFFFEAAIVIAGCTGLIPLTGVTLPFISQGGSSLLAKLVMVGILLGLMARRTRWVVSK